VPEYRGGTCKLPRGSLLGNRASGVHALRRRVNRSKPPRCYKLPGRDAPTTSCLTPVTTVDLWYSMERDWPEERSCACWGAVGGGLAGLGQGAPASFMKASQYPPPKPLYYRASFVHPAVGSDG
jgi:hypothetical protein